MLPSVKLRSTVGSDASTFPSPCCRIPRSPVPTLSNCRSSSRRRSSSASLAHTTMRSCSSRVSGTRGRQPKSECTPQGVTVTFAFALAPPNAAETYPYDDEPDRQFRASPAARVARYASKSTTLDGFGGGFHRCGRSAAISSTPVTLSILARTSARYSTGFTPARVHETTSE